jgi:hypothetical protein
MTATTPLCACGVHKLWVRRLSSTTLARCALRRRSRRNRRRLVAPRCDRVPCDRRCVMMCARARVRGLAVAIENVVAHDRRCCCGGDDDDDNVNDNGRRDVEPQREGVGIVRHIHVGARCVTVCVFVFVTGGVLTHTKRDRVGDAAARRGDATSAASRATSNATTTTTMSTTAVATSPATALSMSSRAVLSRSPVRLDGVAPRMNAPTTTGREAGAIAPPSSPAPTAANAAKAGFFSAFSAKGVTMCDVRAQC